MALIRWAGRTALVVVALVFLSACNSTRNNAFVPVDKSVAAHDYQTAINLLSDPSAGDSFYRADKDLVLQYLDVGMLYHILGNSKASTKNFDEAERLIDEYFTKSITNAALTFIVNDYMSEYAGEDYENIYLNVFKAIDYARLNDFDGVFPEMKRMNGKLLLLKDKYQSLADGYNSSKDTSDNKVAPGSAEFHDSALAHYLSAIVYRGDGRPDDADLELRKLDDVFRTSPKTFAFPKPDLKYILGPTDGKARLNIVGFVGRSPIKKAKTLSINTGKNIIFITTQYENAEGKMVYDAVVPFPLLGVSPGYNFKCQTPFMQPFDSNIATVAVLVDGKPAGNLALIEDMAAVAADTFKLREPIIFTKTLVRTVVKGILAAKAKEAMKKGSESAGFAGALLNFGAGIALDATVEQSEQADLRSARYFPGKAYVGEVLTEPGKHQVVVQYLDKSGTLLWQETVAEKNVGQKGLNLVSSYAVF